MLCYKCSGLLEIDHMAIYFAHSIYSNLAIAALDTPIPSCYILVSIGVYSDRFDPPPFTPETFSTRSFARKFAQCWTFLSFINHQTQYIPNTSGLDGKSMQKWSFEYEKELKSRKCSSDKWKFWNFVVILLPCCTQQTRKKVGIIII